VNAVLGVGLDRLLGGKPAFINFDRTLLLGDWTRLLPPEKSVIEILETVPPDEEVLSACRQLHQQGYALALDACRDDERTAAFATLVDILKVDFQQTSPAHQQKVLCRYRKLKIRMVATKIENEPAFLRGRQLGYDYFQGYFFDRPTILRAASVPASLVCALRLVRQMQREDLDFAAVEELIRQDASFSSSLLAYVNSAAFEWSSRVESVRQSIFLLGADRIRKWVWMASMSSLGQSRSPALMAQVFTRGRFCEEIACAARLSRSEFDPFLLGMLSLLEAILDRPLPGILDDLGIGRNIRDALLGTAGEADPLSLSLRIVKSYEAADWRGVKEAARELGLSAEALSACYLESLSWVDRILSNFEQKWRTDSLPRPIDFHRNPEIRAGIGS
jgi:EAL and modified HD-GYP domain-containing signal transduction protein